LIKAVLLVFVSMLATIASVRWPCLSGAPSLPRIRTLRRLLPPRDRQKALQSGLSRCGSGGRGGLSGVGAGDTPLPGEQAASPVATTVRATQALSAS
jgi:hypothetical protein